MNTKVPRRIRLDLMKPAELAIFNAIQEIEKIGADVRLTNAQTLLKEAKELVSDYIDNVSAPLDKEQEEKFTETKIDDYTY